MSFFSPNEKWSNSSIITKAAAFIMALVFVLSLICDIIMISWGIISFGYAIWYLFGLTVLFLLAFGLYKVSRIAKVLVSWLGFFAALYTVALIWVLAKGDEMAGGLGSLLVGIINALLPDDIKALMVLFVSPYILTILAWLLLFGCGKDFKKIRKEEV
jgi:glucan phosphoethanolaminetransferase (alkaline phosphatase superfamily)